MLETIEKMAPLYRQAAQRPAQRRTSRKRRRPQHLLCSPEYMAQYAARFLQAGARIVGGCCGTTPEHIKEIRNEARSLQPGAPRRNRAGRRTRGCRQAQPGENPGCGQEPAGSEAGGREVRRLCRNPAAARLDASKEIAGAKLCKEAGIDCINVPDGPRASARLSAQVTCQLIQQQAGIEAVLHFCCRDRNILSIQSELLGAHTVGVRNLICITGDPPRMGIYPDATAVFDVDAIGLSTSSTISTTAWIWAAIPWVRKPRCCWAWEPIPALSIWTRSCAV